MAVGSGSGVLAGGGASGAGGAGVGGTGVATGNCAAAVSVGVGGAEMITCASTVAVKVGSGVRVGGNSGLSVPLKVNRSCNEQASVSKSKIAVTTYRLKIALICKVKPSSQVR